MYFLEIWFTGSSSKSVEVEFKSKTLLKLDSIFTSTKIVNILLDTSES